MQVISMLTDKTTMQCGKLKLLFVFLERFVRFAFDGRSLLTDFATVSCLSGRTATCRAEICPAIQTDSRFAFRPGEQRGTQTLCTVARRNRDATVLAVARRC